MVAVAIVVGSGGSALPLVAMVVGGTLINGVAGGIVSAANGGDFNEGFLDGASEGLMLGGIFALGSAAITAIKSGGMALKATGQTIDAKSSANIGKFVSKGSTGRTVPNSLTEQLAMKEAKSTSIKNWKRLDNVTMNDLRWPASEGWVKVEYLAGKYSKTNIHAVYNIFIDVFDDFKFK